jgi:antitoxin VapB
MTNLIAKSFKSGNSLAIRTPSQVAYPAGTELIIERTGDVMTIRPKRPSIGEMLAKLEALPRPSCIEERDEIELPERPGL